MAIRSENSCAGKQLQLNASAEVLPQLYWAILTFLATAGGFLAEPNSCVLDRSKKKAAGAPRQYLSHTNFS